MENWWQLTPSRSLQLSLIINPEYKSLLFPWEASQATILHLFRDIMIIPRYVPPYSRSRQQRDLFETIPLFWRGALSYWLQAGQWSPVRKQVRVMGLIVDQTPPTSVWKAPSRESTCNTEKGEIDEKHQMMTMWLTDWTLRHFVLFLC